MKRVKWAAINTEQTTSHTVQCLSAAALCAGCQKRWGERKGFSSHFIIKIRVTKATCDAMCRTYFSVLRANVSDGTRTANPPCIDWVQLELQSQNRWIVCVWREGGRRRECRLNWCIGQVPGRFIYHSVYQLESALVLSCRGSNNYSTTGKMSN